MSMRKSSASGRPADAEDGRVKQELLKATRRLLSTLGREGATARAICQEVGVGAPAMYHHYGDLTGLHKAAIDETFRLVATTYRRSTKTKGPLQGIRDGWAMFVHFAREEPRMCRIVIQHILAGDPPKAVEGTLRNVAKDLASLDEQKALSCSPEVASQLLWAGALGAVCFESIDRTSAGAVNPVIQQGLLEAVLSAIVRKT